MAAVALGGSSLVQQEIAMSLGWGNSGHWRMQLTRFLSIELTSGCLVLSLKEGEQRLHFMLLSVLLFYLTYHAQN